MTPVLGKWRQEDHLQLHSSRPAWVSEDSVSISPPCQKKKKAKCHTIVAHRCKVASGAQEVPSLKPSSISLSTSICSVVRSLVSNRHSRVILQVGVWEQGNCQRTKSVLHRLEQSRRAAQLPPLIKLIRGPAIAATTQQKSSPAGEVGRRERHFPRMPFMWTQSCHFPSNSVNQDLGAISQSTSCCACGWL